MNNIHVQEKKLRTTKSASEPRKKAPTRSSKGRLQKKEEQTATEEDERLKEELDLLVKILKGNKQSMYPDTLARLGTVIRTSTTSSTAVPKPLKLMHSHYSTMLQIYEKITNDSVKKSCADVISVLAMTSAAEGSRDCLHYRLLGDPNDTLSWGHVYLKHLSFEIAEEWNSLEKTDSSYEKKRAPLFELIKVIVCYYMQHNAETDACDILLEIEQLELIQDYVDAESQPRVCLYLLTCVPFMPDDEYLKMLEIIKSIYLKFNKRIEALHCAIMSNQTKEVKRIFLETSDLIVQKQIAFILARHQIFWEFDENIPFGADLKDFLSNSTLSQHFLSLAKELEISEPKTPDEVYKSQFDPNRIFGTQTPEAILLKISSSLTNGFVNVGFCSEKYLTKDPLKWFSNNRGIGLMLAAASLGLVYRWNIGKGLNAIDKYLYFDEHSKAGALLAIGLINSGVSHEADPAVAVLVDYVMGENPILQIGSILGLGLAYTGSKRSSVQKDVVPFLLKILIDHKAPRRVIATAALSLGLINVGSADDRVSTSMYDFLLTKSEAELRDPNFRLVALGYALNYLGRQNEADAAVEIMYTLKDPFGKMAGTLVECAAYAGTGNVLKIQHLLQICSEHYELSKHGDKTRSGRIIKSARPDYSSQQAVAVLGLALIAMGEDYGSNMCLRLCGHLLRYGDAAVKKAVPLALGLLSVSNPRLNIVEILSKFSHDIDPETSCNATFALGLIGAGTSNSRLAFLLKELASYYQREAFSLTVVRIAQGMLHMGKGTMTLNPYHSDRQLLNPSALAGLLTVCFVMLEPRLLLAQQSYMIYSIVTAIQPRVLITFEASSTPERTLKPINVSVRVGQAVDVVGQAGKPKAITGFQTSVTPVLLAYGERAELAVDDYISVSPVTEGFVILKQK